MIIPSKKIFSDLIKNGTPPLHEEIPYSSPCLMYEAFASPDSFLLESVKGPEKIARYSFLGFGPCMRFRAKNTLMEIEFSGEKKIISSNKPLNVLRSLISRYKQIPFHYLPPFQGGIVGIFSYDFVQYLERLPQNTIDDLALPDADFLMFHKLIAFDHMDKRCWIIVCPGVEDSIKDENTKRQSDWSKQYDEAEDALNDIREKVSRFISRRNDGSPELRIRELACKGKIEIVGEIKKEGYMEMVRRAKEYIAAGDIFQANLSQRVSAHIRDKTAWDLYKTLRSINPSPFAVYMDFGDYQIVSSSPERLLRVKNGIIETRPIAGTRPRGRDWNEDERMRSELLLNEKERAEHIMMIDLERNDLGRVSAYGTLTVDELMITEDYSHVIHIVSNVTGTLAKGKDCFDAIKAVFPGGTITGVPKVRCMEIIDELEPVKRGPYTGSIGYIGFCGNLDLNIIIRTFVIKNNMAYVQAGAGIVADSDPEREYFETLKKAEALIKTLGMV
jgi:anthranilate/para-aminobenzoate synthase component I